MEKKERIVFLDYIRVLAIMFVLGMHSPIPSDHANGVFYSFMTVLCTPCNALFFMVSGALILPMKDSSWKLFLKRRLSKIIFPVIVWSVITMTLFYFEGIKNINEVIIGLSQLPFYPHANYNYWFVYVMIGLYLLTPVISPWIQKSERSDIEYVLFLWMVSLVLMLLAYVGIKMPVVDNSPLYYFGGWAGFFVMGYYLRNYNIKIPPIISISLIVLPFLVYIALKYTNYDYQKVIGYLSLFTTFSAASWFVLFKHIDSPTRLIEIMSNLSFGVYLCHIIIRDVVVSLLSLMFSSGSVSFVLLTWLFTSLFSFSIVYILSKIPFSQYIIGYKSRN